MNTLIIHSVGAISVINTVIEAILKEFLKIKNKKEEPKEEEDKEEKIKNDDLITGPVKNLGKKRGKKIMN